MVLGSNNFLLSLEIQQKHNVNINILVEKITHKVFDCLIFWVKWKSSGFAKRIG